MPPIPTQAAFDGTQVAAIGSVLSVPGVGTMGLLAEPPAVVGGYALGPKIVHGTHYVFVTHYKPRWLTRKMMSWFFELHWKPVDATPAPLTYPMRAEKKPYRAFVPTKD
jgi:hypothetical protein